MDMDKLHVRVCQRGTKLCSFFLHIVSCELSNSVQFCSCYFISFFFGYTRIPHIHFSWVDFPGTITFEQLLLLIFLVGLRKRCHSHLINKWTFYARSTRPIYCQSHMLCSVRRSDAPWQGPQQFCLCSGQNNLQSPPPTEYYLKGQTDLLGQGQLTWCSPPVDSPVLWYYIPLVNTYLCRCFAPACKGTWLLSFSTMLVSILLIN